MIVQCAYSPFEFAVEEVIKKHKLKFDDEGNLIEEKDEEPAKIKEEVKSSQDDQNLDGNKSYF